MALPTHMPLPQRMSMKKQLFLLGCIISFALISWMSVDAYIGTRVKVLPFEEGGPVDYTKGAHGSDAGTNTDLSSAATVLLVSAYFPLPSHLAKHPRKAFSTWIPLFLSTVKTPIYFYTTPEYEPQIRAWRGSLPIIINTTFATPFETPPLSGKEDLYKEMWKIDREKKKHSKDLYAIWNAKPYFLEEGAKNYNDGRTREGQRAEYAFWTDAGSFRQPHAYRNWPDAKRVNDIWNNGTRLGVDEKSGRRRKKEDIMFIPMYGMPHSSMSFWNEGMGPVDNEFSEGSFFGGPVAALSWFSRTFYSYHDSYIDQHVFVGKDQTLINSIIILHPQRFLTVWAGDPKAPETLEGMTINYRTGSVEDGALGECGSRWNYYQYFFASASEQSSMANSWLKWRPWKLSWWTSLFGGGGKGERCRVTRVLGMESVLRRRFGEGWRIPGSTFGN